MPLRPLLICSALALLHATAQAAPAGIAAIQTKPLTNSGDLSAQMVAGIDRWLTRETDVVASERAQTWNRELAKGKNSEPFKQAKRARLKEMIGATDPLVASPRLQFLGNDTPRTELFRTKGPNGFAAYHVRWPVLEDLFAEGLLLQPLHQSGEPLTNAPAAVALPDADQTPEMLAGLDAGIPAASQLARHLAASGWRVLVPVLVSREDFASGNARVGRFTNQPHREWIYRQACEMGRHIIGYEVQKVLAGISALQSSNVAVAGYGEGGLVALHAAAVDSRIGGVLVSGYFGPRQELWREPIYRNLFGYLREFSDAELAALIAPRKVIVEHARFPEVKGPPATRPGRSGAAPGAIVTADLPDIEAEVHRANELAPGLRGTQHVEMVHGSEGSMVQFGSRKALALLSTALGVTNRLVFTTDTNGVSIMAVEETTERQERTVRELERFTQALFRRSENVRAARFAQVPARAEQFTTAMNGHRDVFWREVIGKIEAAKLPPNPRLRPVHDKPAWTGYEVMLDVLPDVFAWGVLLVPKDLKAGEQRPVVVCQHGLEGLPEDTIIEDPNSKAFAAYQAYAARLAERGFIVYAPHNPYRGGDRFRVLQRKANPLGLSLFSFIIAQHGVTTDWLASLPFVDPKRIAFYGLSYGGKTAMRVPAVLDRYGLSICSADFNEWIQKNVTTEATYSYLFTGEYEMPEWNLGHTFNYAEMAALIAPRPFMVERGHDDGVAPDTWVAYEFAKVRRLYDKLGIGERAEIEFFDGPHRINAVGTFDFLHRHLNWPARK